MDRSPRGLLRQLVHRGALCRTGVSWLQPPHPTPNPEAAVRPARGPCGQECCLAGRLSAKLSGRRLPPRLNDWSDDRQPTAGDRGRRLQGRAPAGGHRDSFGNVATAQRRGFTRLLDRLEPGDVLVVTKLDRLGRNVTDVGSTVAKLAELGVRIHCLALGGVDLTSSTGKLTMNVLNAVAEFERDLLVECRLRDGGTVSALACEFNTSRQTIMRVRDACTLIRSQHLLCPGWRPVPT